MNRIYLDNNATTAIAPEVLKVLCQDFNSYPANPSSVHFFGREARAHLIAARQLIAQFFKVKPQEIVFTSGGTESLNMLIRGVLLKSTHPCHIITSNVEHSCVFNTLQLFEQKGWDVSYLPAGLFGAIGPEEVKKAITPKTSLIVLGAVNNETGVKTDIESIAKIASEHNIACIVDGVALLGKESCNIPPGVMGMGFSGHKIHAPKGVGIAFVRSSFKIEPLFTGGDQEGGKRAGTENLAAILALAKAISLINLEDFVKMQKLRDHLERELKEKIPGLSVNGEGPRICNTSNLSIPGYEGESLLMKLDQLGIAASHGSACASGALEPSRILTNMGLSKERAGSSIRFSLSRFTTQAEIDHTIKTILSLTQKRS